MKIFIMQGIPGSGKSHWIEEFVKKTKEELNAPFLNYEVCSADHYMMERDKYVFRPSKLPEAHKNCFLQFLATVNHLEDHKLPNLLFVDNTNLSLWEIAPYYRLGEALEFETKIVRVLCPLEVAYKRNVHNVPLGNIFDMHRNFCECKLPSHWNVLTVLGHDDKE